MYCCLAGCHPENIVGMYAMIISENVPCFYRTTLLASSIWSKIPNVLNMRLHEGNILIYYIDCFILSKGKGFLKRNLNILHPENLPVTIIGQGRS